MVEFVAADPPAEPPAGTVAVLPEVLVPVCWWRGLPFDRAAPVAMTPLERFVLELAMTTGRADPAEFFEITNLPGATLLPVAARRLAAAGALARDGDGYLPVSPGAERAARTRTVYRSRRVGLDVVLLPRTGDLLLLEPRSSGLREVERLRPRSVGNAPVPPRLAGGTLVDELRARLAAGTVAGADEEITDVVEPDTGVPVIGRNGWCPVYRCRGELRLDGDRYLPVLTFAGNGRRDPVRLELPGATGLAEHWRGLLDAFDDPANQARAWTALLGAGGDAADRAGSWEALLDAILDAADQGRPLDEILDAARDPSNQSRARHERPGAAEPAPAAERTGPRRWRCAVTETLARRLGEQGRNLALPLGLTARGEDAVAELAIELVGADPAAEALIEVDRLLSAAAAPGAEVTDLPSSTELRDRAWRLGFPGLAYALREAEDFRYA